MKAIYTKSLIVVLYLSLNISLNSQVDLSSVDDKFYNPSIVSEPNNTLPYWVQYMYENSKDIANISSYYNNYYENNDFIKNQHTQFYKRLVRRHSRINYSSTELQDKKQFLALQQKYIKKRNSSQSKTPGQWTTLGPYDLDIDATGTGNTPGTAHVFHLDYCLNYSQHMLAGTATAGLWKSSNSGVSWEIITKDLSINTVKAASYDIQDPSIIYFTANHSFYKTVNGGYDWTITGGAPLENTFFNGVEIIVNPNNADEIFLATNAGLFKSENKGDQFELLEPGSILDIEFHPTNSAIIYILKAISNRTEFYRSLDGGDSFEMFNAGYPIPGNSEHQKRTQISVSLDEPDALWAIAVGKVNGGNGLVGIYKSVDKGENWLRQCCGNQDGGAASLSNPNIMEWDCPGDKDGGQYYYDLAIAVNPSNANQLITGGINLWLSADGGENMTCISDYIYSKSPQTYVHADIHSIKFIDGNAWVASDGGIFYSTDNMQSFNKKMNGIVGTDFRGFAVGYFDKEIMVGGTYHNGTFLKENDAYINDWVSTRSGDNSRAAVNEGNNNLIYDHTSMRELSGDRLIIPHNVSFPRKPNASFTIGESSEIVFDPFSFNTLYLGQGASIYRSENNGVTFDKLKSFGQGLVTAIEKSSTDNDLLYCVHYPSFGASKKLYRSMDGGSSFTDVTPPENLFENEYLWVALDITIGSSNPYDIWLARIPQTTYGVTLDGVMIYYSSNAGDSWVNVTTPELDGEYPTNIVHQIGTNKGVYLGTRRAVYYRSDSYNDWQLVSVGLPASTFSTKLIPHYKTGMIINASQRGVYEMEFVELGEAIAVPTVDKKISDCLRDTFYFLDRSPVVDVGATRLWTFTGADNPTSTEFAPKVTYSIPGKYSVQLEVTNSQGTDSFYQLEYVEVKDGCSIDSVVGSSVEVGNGAFVKVPRYKKTFDELTISCWVKRQGVIYEHAGVVLHRDGPIGTGMTIDNNGRLSYLWDEVNTNYDSGLFVPYNKWAHIAISVSSTSVRLYVDGEESIRSVSNNPVELLENFFIGSDEFASSNFMAGNIDEVRIYGRALTGEEIRLKMNLTEMSQDTTLISYFQANNSTGMMTDRVGHAHAFLMNSAIRIPSKAPVGAGCAEEHIIDLPGTYDFGCADVSLTFEDGDVLPMGPVSIAKVKGFPDMPYPEGTAFSENYWVFTNSGTNTTFSPPSNMAIGDFGWIDSNYVEFPEFYQFYKVPTYWEYGWGSAYDMADSVSLENNTTLIFDDVLGMTSSGKLIITEEGLPALAIVDHGLTVSVIAQNDRLIEWNLSANILDYEIWRSIDGISFDRIKVIQHQDFSVNNGKVNYVDKEDMVGSIYYQLIAQDLFENESESKKVNVWISELQDVQFYPNILSSGQGINIVHTSNEILHCSILDLHGRLVRKYAIKNKKEFIFMDINSGTYIIEFREGEDVSQGKLIMM